MPGEELKRGNVWVKHPDPRRAVIQIREVDLNAYEQRGYVKAHPEAKPPVEAAKVHHKPGPKPKQHVDTEE